MVHPPLEPPGLDLPDGVPVDVGRALVGDLAVGKAADRVRVEQIRRCGDRERCRTAPRRCRSAAVGWCRAASRWRPSARGACPSTAPRRRCSLSSKNTHASVLSVAGLPFVGLLLEEVADRLRCVVDLLVQPAVDVERAAPTPRTARTVSGHDRRRHGRRASATAGAPGGGASPGECTRDAEHLCANRGAARRHGVERTRTTRTQKSGAAWHRDDARPQSLAFCK